MAKRSSNGFGWLLAIAAIGGALQAARAAMRWVEQHPVWTVLAVVTVLALAITWTVVVVRARRDLAARQAELERSISSTDGMTGPQFERWLARLLARTGFTEIENCGGAGDMGADVIAMSPEGVRVVFQCKRYSKNVPSGDVQRFGGTCRAIHGAGIAAVVTTAGFSKPAQDMARRLEIVLVDRGQLAAWAADYIPPSTLIGARASTWTESVPHGDSQIAMAQHSANTRTRHRTADGKPTDLGA